MAKNLQHSKCHLEYNRIKRKHDTCLELADAHLKEGIFQKSLHNYHRMAIEFRDVKHFRKEAGKYHLPLTQLKRAIAKANREYNQNNNG